MWKYNYTYTPEEEYLMHYGVKGMKWDLEKRKKKFANDFRRTVNSTKRKINRGKRKVRKAAGIVSGAGKAMAKGYMTGVKRGIKKNVNTFKSEFKKGYKKGYDYASRKKKRTTSSKASAKNRRKKGLSGLPVEAPFAIAAGIVKAQNKKRRKATSKNQKMRRPPKRV